MWFVPFSLRDLIDILLVAMIMYWIYRATKGTNAPYILTGIIAIYMLWVVVRALNMELLSSILGQIISVGVIALIVVFQPEIRRFLQMIGMRRKRLGFILNIFSSNNISATSNVDPLVEACTDMADSRTGALIVIGQQSDLRLITDGGIALDAMLSTQLLKNIFFKNSPLHDGAVVLMGDRIVAAKCILPVTQSEVPKSYGTRHLAAIGISEISDAVVIVVSEETGKISIAQSGHLYRNLEAQRLSQILQRFLSVSRRRETAAEVAE
ncbi:MAG: diadenylate cyclase CdaA [Rikenellaceae bacterium]